MEISTNTTEPNEYKESMKLTKNTKGYNWEIKVFALETPVLDENGARTLKTESKIMSTDIDRLARLNDELMQRFGSLTE